MVLVLVLVLPVSGVPREGIYTLSSPALSASENPHPSLTYGRVVTLAVYGMETGRTYPQCRALNPRYFFGWPTNGAKRENGQWCCRRSLTHTHSLDDQGRGVTEDQNERTRDTHSPVGGKLEHTLVTRGPNGQEEPEHEGKGREGKRGRISRPGDAVIAKPNMYSRPKKPSKRESYLVKMPITPVLSPWFRSRESRTAAATLRKSPKISRTSWLQWLSRLCSEKCNECSAASIAKCAMRFQLQDVGANGPLLRFDSSRKYFAKGLLFEWMPRLAETGTGNAK
jgi:hypothetical protein